MSKQAQAERERQSRIILGTAVGHLRGEFEALNVPFEQRGAMTDEYLRAMVELWTSSDPCFQGRYVRFENVVFEPKPVQRPRPPFVIGGTGPKRTIPLAAKWADQWNFPDYTWDLDLFTNRLALLDAECEKIGRDRSSIEVSVQFRYSGDLAESVDRIRVYEDAGADHVLVSFTPPADPSLPPRLADALR